MCVSKCLSPPPQAQRGQAKAKAVAQLRPLKPSTRPKDRSIEPNHESASKVQF